jgi:hypothetical protein
MAAFRIVLIALVVALPLLVVTRQAQACSIAPFSYAEVATQVDLIVIGTVHDIRIVSFPATPQPGGTVSPGSQLGDLEWTVDVEEYVKGSGPAQLTYTSRTDIYPDETGELRFHPGLSASCGWAPQEGRYLLFAVSNEGRYVSGFPNILITPETEQQALQSLDEVRTALRHGVSLPYTGSGPPAGAREPIGAIVAAAALTGLLLASTALFLRRT